MRIKPGKLTCNQKAPWFLWLLLSASFLIALLEIPVASMVHSQLGMRAFLRAAFRSEPPSSSAVSHFRKVNNRPDSQPGLPNSYRMLGLAALAADNPAVARGWLLRRLETAPEDFIARFWLGETYLRIGDTQAAIREWQAAGAQLQLMGLAENLVEREAWGEALTALDAVMQLDATDIDSRCLAAEIWREQGDAERALALSQEVIALDPGSVIARRLMVDILREQGDTERALALSQDIIAIAPDKPVGYALVGLIMFDRGEYDQAAASFQQTVERYATSPRWLLISLARSYAALGKWHEAIDAYREGIHQEPGHYWDYVLMGDAQCQVGNSQEALIYYQKAMALGNERTDVAAAIEHIAQYGECPP
jgi:tetratricopeptide (TPR) repeat protein